jgi:predicted GIY-YIG superfamily endonuclease
MGEIYRIGNKRYYKDKYGGLIPAPNLSDIKRNGWANRIEKAKSIIDAFSAPEEFILKKIACVYFLLQGDEIVYIGQTVDIHNRISVHTRKKNKKFNKVLYHEVKKKNLLIVENYLIKKYKPKYNLKSKWTTTQDKNL